MNKKLFVTSKNERRCARKWAIAGFVLAFCGAMILYTHASILNAEVDNANKKLAKVSTMMNRSTNGEQDAELSRCIDDYNKAAGVVNARSTQMPLYWAVSKVMGLPKYELL